MDFYRDTAIEDCTCVNLVEHYHARSGQKDLKKVMDYIKKDLQKVADFDSEFEVTRKGKAREILNDWKPYNTWRTPRNNKYRRDFSTGMKLRGKKKIDYTKSPTETNSSGSEYQEKPKKVTYTSVFQNEIKSSSSPARSSSSSIQPGSQRQTLDLLTDSDEVERVQMSEEDFNKFTKVFQKLENKKKWVLTSEKVVVIQVWNEMQL
ncbi:12681_t:CDS:2 [Funneliformis geosporum]|uniref:12681_t:CDS:1 n=1 Tax=Funneliformis geosporum TaxID=1117311 RepID=A0A9W4SVN7_9GLOM|nr:12681_t:CDS:2 [Funneliformis geosporum]